VGETQGAAFLTQSSCVVAGSWNPAILQPAWMVKQGILPNGGGKIELAAPIGQPTPMPLVARYTLADLSWVAQPMSLEVQPAAEGANPGLFVASVLEKLSHTPIRAVGNNFNFDPGTAGVKLLDVFHCAGWDRLRGSAEEVGSRVGVRLSHDTGVVNVTVVSSATAVTELQFNFHREMVEVSEAIEAARKWADDSNAAKALAARIVEGSR